MTARRCPADSVTRACLMLVVVATIAFAALGLATRPAMYSDSSFGLAVWDSMKRGAGFNVLVYPDPADIARDTSEFSTTWSPGQYLLPAAFERLGFDLGTSLMVVVTLCSAIGLGAWYGLYRAVGFSPRTCAIALLVVTFNRAFSLPFGIYNGGEVLLFAAMPLGFLVAWRLRDLRWWSPLPLVLATAGLVFLKLSGVVYMAAAVSSAVLCSGPPWIGREILRKAIVAGITLAALALLLQWAWLSRGWNVLHAATQTDWPQLWKILAFTVASLWTSIFSFGSLLQYVFFFPGQALLPSDAALNVLLVLPALATFAFVWRSLHHDHATYLRFVFGAVAAAAVFFVALWLHKGDVTMDERHFRSLSLLLLVGLVEACLVSSRRIVRAGFAGLAGLAALYGVASCLQHARSNLKVPLGDRGVRLSNASAEVLAFVRQLDKAAAGDDGIMVYLSMPELTLEMPNTRSLTSHADFDPPEQLLTDVYRGRVKRLYVILQKTLVANGKAEIILKSFVDYRDDDWQRSDLDRFVVFSSLSR